MVRLEVGDDIMDKKKENKQKVKAFIGSDSTRKLTQYGLLLSIMVLMTVFPIGYIRIGIIEATLMHIPVIVAAIMFGVKGGAFFGLCFGISSVVSGIMSPTPLSMALLGMNTGFGAYNLFLIVVIIFLPRVLVGVFTALVYKPFLKKAKRAGGAALAALTGSLTNTTLVLGFIYLFAKEMFAKELGVDVAEVATILFTVTGVFNGIIEIVCAVSVAVPVSEALRISRANKEYDRTHKSAVRSQIIEAENETEKYE